MSSDVAMLERLAAPSGKDVVDVGCGGGALVRELSARGARVTGVEISEGQLAAATSLDDGGGGRYLIGRAQRLPLDDASVDLAVFMRTLHHVPPAELMQALHEARRVIRRDGAVYVAEPLAKGDYFELVSLVEDELDVRSAAQAALARASEAGLLRARTVEYDVRLCIADLAMLRARIVSVDPTRADSFDARRDELAEAFERLGEPGQGHRERCFFAPMRADVLRPARGAPCGTEGHAAVTSSRRRRMLHPVDGLVPKGPVRRYRKSLEMLEQDVPDSSLVELLRFELEALEQLPPEPGSVARS
jgi:SAM-dependent methyltransferase